MKIIESYMPVFQKWGDNDLSIYYEAKGFQYYDSTTIFDCCFLSFFARPLPLGRGSAIQFLKVTTYSKKCH